MTPRTGGECLIHPGLDMEVADEGEVMIINGVKEGVERPPK